MLCLYIKILRPIIDILAYFLHKHNVNKPLNCFILLLINHTQYTYIKRFLLQFFVQVLYKIGEIALAITQDIKKMSFT